MYLGRGQARVIAIGPDFMQDGFYNRVEACINDSDIIQSTAAP